MKLKQIEIKIKSLDQSLDDFVETAKKIGSGKKVVRQKGIYVADPETARAIFTDARLKIIRTLKEKKPNSIYELAKILERDFKNVYDDISFLSQLGIIAVEEMSSGRKQKKPILLCDRILFAIAA